VVYVAWRQYNSARELTIKMQSIIQNQLVDILDRERPRPHLQAKETDRSSKEHPCWTMTHSFYAGMGGFTIDTYEKDKPEYIPYSPRLTLGTKGLLLLAEHTHYIPDIPEEAISDRSKSNFLTKSLVCLQAAWIIVECINRLAGGFPITLLEINTVGHVICALIMYVFWFYKPQEVREPTVLSGDWIRAACAFLFMISPLSASDCLYFTGPPSEASWLFYYNNTHDTKSVQSLVHKHDRPSGWKKFNHNPPFRYGWMQTPVLILQEFESLQVPGFGPHEKPVELDQIGVTRWLLAAQFLAEQPKVQQVIRDRDVCQTPHYFSFGCFTVEHGTEFIVSSMPDWSEQVFVNSSTWIQMAGIAFATVLYGGLHAGAWNSEFPSWQERLIWRVSACVIASTGFIIGIVIVVDSVIGALMRLYAEWQARKFPPMEAQYSHILKKQRGIDLSSEITRWCLYVLLVPYVFSRLYLVTEAFVSLRAVPLGAYQTPTWTQWIPHL
jgi:hypothetical protein